MVTITKQRRHIFLAEAKRTLNADLQEVKFAQVVFVPNRSNYRKIFTLGNIDCASFVRYIFGMLECEKINSMKLDS